MTPDALGTTNLWLGIIAIVSLIEFLVLAGAAFMAYRFYVRATTMLEEVERRHVAPVAARVTAILDDVKGITARVQNVETQVTDMIHRVDSSAARTVANVKSRLWPIVGVARGVRAAIATAAAPARDESHGEGATPIAGWTMGSDGRHSRPRAV